mmetsp:Transcript_472/g.1350  ORF Transcript_472/g.1350 Transcript_472/m.1350 type:complete len:336 (-) Transcript_472:310-1317(-)
MRGQLSSLSPRLPSCRCLWNSSSAISSSIRQACCMLRGGSRSTRAALPPCLSRSAAKTASTTPLSQVTLHKPISGAALVRRPGPTRRSLGCRGHTRSPFTSSAGFTAHRAPSGLKSDSRASTTRRRASSSHLCSESPRPVETQHTKRPSSFAGRTAPRLRRRSSPVSRATRTRPPTKPTTLPGCSSPALSSSIVASSSSSGLTSTASPARRSEPLRSTCAGSIDTTCHSERSVSADSGAHAEASWKSDCLQPPAAASDACGVACHRSLCASSHRLGPLPKATSGASAPAAPPWCPAAGAPGKSSMSQSLRFEASGLPGRPAPSFLMRSQSPRLDC